MPQRNERNEEIVRQLEVDANKSAATYIAEVEAYARQSRLKCMADLLEEFAEWMEEEGDLDRLRSLGVELREAEGLVRLNQGVRKMTLRARDDMSILVDGTIMHPNCDCPILDDNFYGELMARINRWASPQDDDRPRRYFE